MQNASKILGLAIMAIFSAQVAFAEPKIFTEKEIQILSNMSELEVTRYTESRFIDLLKDCNRFNEGYYGDKTDYQALFDAVIARNHKKAQKLLHSKLAPKYAKAFCQPMSCKQCVFYDGIFSGFFGQAYTPLGIAIFYNDIKMAKLLIENKKAQRQNTQEIFNNDIVIKAVEFGDEAMFRFLLTQGMSPNALDIEFSPLWRVAYLGRRDLVMILLENGAEIDFVDYYNNHTALSIAISNRHYDIAKLLIKQGANINGVLNGDRKSKPPLFEVIKNGDKNMATFLLKNGANINATNDSRESVLMQSWNVEINEWLIKQGANVNLKDNNGNTALIRAAIDNCEELSYSYYGEEEGVENVWRYDIARLFIKKGANPNAQNNEGQSAISIARKCKDNKMLQILNGKNLKYEFR